MITALIVVLWGNGRVHLYSFSWRRAVHFFAGCLWHIFGCCCLQPPQVLRSLCYDVWLMVHLVILPQCAARCNGVLCGLHSRHVAVDCSVSPLSMCICALHAAEGMPAFTRMACSRAVRLLSHFKGQQYGRQTFSQPVLWVSYHLRTRTVLCVCAHHLASMYFVEPYRFRATAALQEA